MPSLSSSSFSVKFRHLRSILTVQQSNWGAFMQVFASSFPQIKANTRLSHLSSSIMETFQSTSIGRKLMILREQLHDLNQRRVSFHPRRRSKSPSRSQSLWVALSMSSSCAIFRTWSCLWALRSKLMLLVSMWPI